MKLLLALVVACALWWQLVLAPAWSSPGWDFAPVVLGAEVVKLDGRTHLYDHDPFLYCWVAGSSFGAASQQLGLPFVSTPFVYPPIVAWLARPLTFLSYPTVLHVWMIVACLAAVLGVLLTLLTFAPGLAASPVLLALIVGLCACLEPFRYALLLGQTTPLVFLLVVWALRAGFRGKPVLAGALLSIPAFIKLTPLLLAGAWLAGRQWKSLVSLGAGLLILTIASVALMGVAPHVAYFERLRQISSITLVSYNNQSLLGALTRFGRGPDEVSQFEMLTPSGLAKTIATVTGGLLVLMAFFSSRGGDEREAARIRAAAWVLPMLLVASISWTHYFVFLLIVAPVAMSLLVRMGARLSVALTGALLPLILCVRPLLPEQDRPVLQDSTIVATPMIAALLYAAIFLVARLREGGGPGAAHVAETPATAVQP